MYTYFCYSRLFCGFNECIYITICFNDVSHSFSNFLYWAGSAYFGMGYFVRGLAVGVGLSIIPVISGIIGTIMMSTLLTILPYPYLYPYLT